MDGSFPSPLCLKKQKTQIYRLVFEKTKKKIKNSGQILHNRLFRTKAIDKFVKQKETREKGSHILVQCIVKSAIFKLTNLRKMIF